jgi:hypothetical protein
MTTTINMIDYPENGPEVKANLGTTISGEDADNNRLLTCEVWNYGEANLTASGAVKAAPGILGVAQVLAEDVDETVTFYDFVATTEAPAPTDEVILGVMKLTTGTLGTQIYFRRPASVGIWAEFSAGADTGVVAVGYL